MRTRRLSGEITYAAGQYVRERDYWLNKLAGDWVKTAFPYDIKKPAREERKMAEVKFGFSRELFLKVTGLSKGLDHRLHMILTAVLVVLLEKYTGSKDIVVGAPIYKQEIEGDFINTVLVLRNQWDDNVTFKELLLNVVRPTIRDAAGHQNYPVETLMYQLDMPFSQDGFALFDAAILLESIHDRKYLEHTTPNMIFVFSKNGEYLECLLEYNSLLYYKSTIERIINHFIFVLEQVVFNINKEVSCIDILSEKERGQLLVDFNDTKTGYPGEKTIDELLEEQAGKKPFQVALSDENHGDSLTYEELDERSNRLAVYLRAGGITGEEAVGIMGEESNEMIVGILAILKAGGAYLPINWEYPEERKNYLLKDGQVRILLTNCSDVGCDVGDVVHLHDPEIYKCDVSFKRTHKYNSLAYIIYTSGSTGTPKGIMVEHGSVVRLVKNTNYVEFREEDRIFQTGALEFDASTFEIWGALLNGLVLYVADRETILTAGKLKGAVLKNKITTMWMTAPLFNRMLDTDIEIFSGLRNLLVGGDALSPVHINRLRKKFPRLNVINGYGPTENTTFSTTYLINREYKDNIPIGKPIANSTAYIVDKNGNLLPIGVPGELWVGGDGVARGYLNNPGLTAEKFINYRSYRSYRSYSLYFSKKLYKTGDLARWLPDGNIEFLGRLDHQVKIRGYRIEPGEIESRLTNITGIKEAIVTPREDRDGEKCLCAYIVLAPPKKIDIPELRSILSRNVPDYMIPSYITQVDHIPLTANGKVDRRALPEPEAAVRGEGYTAPGNEREEKLVEIWSAVLGIEKEVIGIDADFFELGGHSLKATILITEIHKELNVNVPLAEIFKTPTIRELSRYIDGMTEDKYAAIEVAEKKEYYPLSSAQKRLYILQQMEKTLTCYNIPVTAALLGDFAGERMERAFKELIIRHESFRTGFEMIGEDPFQRIHDEVEFEIEYYDLAAKAVARHPKTKDREDIIKSFIRPFDLSCAPLLRVGLIREAGKKHILMVDMHHIVSDGTSMGILITEFMALVEGNRLPGLRLQYRDFSQWQNSLLRSGDLKKQQEYWRKVFTREIPTLNLPTDYTRPSLQSFAGSAAGFVIEAEPARALEKIAREQGTTLFKVLLAAFNIFLFKLSGQEDIIVGTPTAGRRHADLQQIIGMFVNTLALRNYPAARKTVKEFIKEIKERTLQAFENQEYQFEDLVDMVSARRDASRNPLFDVVFVLQNMDKPEVTSDELKLIPFQQESDVSKFDMTLAAVEADDGLFFTFEYCTKLFKPKTIERFTGYFKKVVAAVLRDPGQEIAEIEIITEEEKRQLLIDFNRTEAKYPEDKTIHRLFEEQARRTPDGVAVGAQGTVPFSMDHISITYKELNEKSNQLAHVLREKGIGPDTIAAIMMERTVDMIIGLLGILKTGGAYLPIDPDYPRERIEYMLNDSNAALLLTACELVDICRGTACRASIRQGTACCAPTNLAYVIYTSGTTGQPKGCLIEHRNVVRLLFNDKFQFDFNHRDVWTMFHSYNFDFSVWEMYGALLYGGKLIVVPKMTARDPRGFLDILKRQKVTVLNQTPSAFYHLIDEELKYAAGTLYIRYIIFGGEALRPVKLKEWRDRYPGIKLVNMFGITETTVHATYKEIGDKEVAADISSIGNPIPTLSTYVMDNHLKLLPPGVPGELYVGGAGVGRGYLNRGELTGMKFIENPYKPGEKLYRSGDLVKLSENGEMEYLGRIDHQVNIKGFRIELGEIESRLLKHDDIKEAVVTAGEDAHLCAYIVPGKEITLSLSGLREFLSRDLPDYMIPAYFAQLERLPLTANGKIDRKALSRQGEFLQTGNRYVPPRNPIESEVVEVWRQVLNVERVGIYDNFFEIGGDSMGAIQVVSRLIKNFDINIAQIFEHQTAVELSANITLKKSNIKSKIEEIKNQVEMAEIKTRTDPRQKDLEEEYRAYLQKAKGEKYRKLKTRRKYRHILLTGVTGYLGAHLAGELLKETKAKLYLPVRGHTGTEAEEYVKRKLDFYLGAGFFAAFANRVEVVRGDLVEDKLGMAAGDYRRLAETVDAVVHAAANVKHFGVYREFYRDNVEVSQRLLEYSLTGKQKDFHYISTMSVCSGSTHENKYTLYTEFTHDAGQEHDNVYIKSKFAAEKKVLAYREKGLDASIYRMGNLVFHSRTGKFQENIEENAFYANMKAYISLGIVPDAEEMGFEMTFIDSAARALVLLITSQKSENETYHLQNNHRLNWKQMDLFLENEGIKVQVITPGQFFDYLLENLDDRAYSTELDRLMLYSGLFEPGRQNRGISLAVSDRTHMILEKLGFQWPEVTDDHIEKMIDYCKKVGFLPGM